MLQCISNAQIQPETFTSDKNWRKYIIAFHGENFRGLPIRNVGWALLCTKTFVEGHNNYHTTRKGFRLYTCTRCSMYYNIFSLFSVEVADSTDIKDVPPIVAYTSSDSPPATMTQTELKITDNDVMGSDESKISTNGLEVCCIHQRRSSTVPPRVSFSTVDQHSLSTSSNRPRRSAFKSSLGLSRPMRKRYTTSDELTVLQLQGAKDEPSCDPAILLRQYQILSLGYSLTLTSSPYIQSLLTNYTPSSEAHNYRRSFLLEPA